MAKSMWSFYHSKIIGVDTDTRTAVSLRFQAFHQMLDPGCRDLSPFSPKIHTEILMSGDKTWFTIHSKGVVC